MHVLGQDRHAGERIDRALQFDRIAQQPIDARRLKAKRLVAGDFAPVIGRHIRFTYVAAGDMKPPICVQSACATVKSELYGNHVAIMAQLLPTTS